MTPAEEHPVERLAKRARSSFTKSADVLVGKEIERCIVHLDIIQPRSPFFDAAIKRWKGAETSVVLRDVKPEVFAVHLGCLYHSKIALHDDDDRYTNLSPTGRTYAKLMDLYHLADSIGDLTTCNMTIDHLIKEISASDSLPPRDLVCRTWTNTADSSPLRRLLVDIYIFKLSRKALQLQWSARMYRRTLPVRFCGSSRGWCKRIHGWIVRLCSRRGLRVGLVSIMSMMPCMRCAVGSPTRKREASQRL
ncbi:hypothetical protein LTR86_000161 [Recurvomyces mirabilis]|nr:hypothetical protein LTR86_000161 [Recurvomyces mirabilis]